MGAILRLPGGRGPAGLVAWGLRNPFGLAFAPDGRLFVTENGYDVRGSRPVWGAADLLWAVEPGRWYGWPDFSDGEPLDAGRFTGPGAPTPPRLLAAVPEPPPRAVARFGVNSSANGLDFSRSEAFGHVGQAFVALFGDMAPATGKLAGPVGFKVVRVDPATGVVEEFAVNRGRTNGPASRLGTHGLERPIAVRFDPRGDALFVVDFGVLTMDGAAARPVAGSGAVWRIARSGA